MERQTVSKAQQPASHNTQVHAQSASAGAAQHPVLALQQSIGNRAVQRLIQSRYIQAKLQVGPPGDQYEQEADRVADTVMRMPDPQLSSGVTVSNRTPISHVHRKCTECEEEEMQRQPVEEEEETLQGKRSAVQTSVIQRLCSQCENKVQRQPLEEEPFQPPSDQGLLQGKAEGGAGLEVSPRLETQIGSLRGGGQRLPQSVRAHFEPRFGHDFSGVRLHTGPQAAQLSQSINAQAFTIGRDVAFGAGQYSPETSKGQRLLAHELTHVVQQGGAAPTSIGSEQGQASTVQRKNSSSGTDIIQRAGDPAAIPRGFPCTPDFTTNPPSGTDVLFATGRSTITPAHTIQLTTFVASWRAAGGTNDVLVHGYASTVGGQGRNWTLSCDRALAVQAELIRLGIPAARIKVDAHGESTDFGASAAANQHAVVSMPTPKPTPPGPAPTPPAPPPAAETITSRTIALSPGARTRTTIGVGELVELTHTPGSAAWTRTAGTLSATNGVTVILTAPDSAQIVTVTAGAATIAFDVIAPTDVHMDRFGTTGVKHQRDHADSGIETQPFYLPDTVNFNRVIARELNVAAVVTNPGAYSCFTGFGHCRRTAGGACNDLALTDTVVPRKGTRALLRDCVYSGDCQQAAPFTPGTITFAIPYEYKVGAGAFHPIRTVTQVSRLAPDRSTLTSSKGGESGTTTVAAGTVTNPASGGLQCP